MTPRVPIALAALLAGCSSDPTDETKPSPTDNRIDRVEALIVAPDSLAGEYEPLATWRNETGLRTRVVALSEALAQGSGPDDAARLRDYLRARWESGDLRFVTLAGDADCMPVRSVFATVDIEAEDVYEEADVTSELYFADLDGDWDPDADGVYGELGDPADLLPDIAIGRIPACTQDEARAYVHKLVAYESGAQSDYQDRVLLVGGYAGHDIYGSAGLEVYVVPSLPEELTLTRLYEDHATRPGAIPCTADTVNTAFSEGQHLAFVMGHGNETSLGPLTTCSQVSSLDNALRPSILFTCECLGGRFDYDAEDSAGEAFVLGATGGVAYLGSTHLGVGFPSLSVVMQRFARSMYDDEPGVERLGLVLQESLRTYAKAESLHTETHPDRWTQLVTVLLGDPATAVWTRRPMAVQVDVGRPSCSQLDVVVTTMEGDPVEGATLAGFVPDTWLGTTTTDVRGRATLRTADCTLKSAHVTVSGDGIVPFRHP